MPTRSKSINRKSAVKANDWELVKKQVEADEPIAFDPEVDPYDPNDEAAVEAFWASATITRGRGRPPAAVGRRRHVASSRRRNPAALRKEPGGRIHVDRLRRVLRGHASRPLAQKGPVGGGDISED